ncbi:unnamed protein product, partial [marine sediment metagenome]
DEIGRMLKKYTKGIKSLIVTNPTIAEYYLESNTAGVKNSIRRWET